MTIRHPPAANPPFGLTTVGVAAASGTCRGLVISRRRLVPAAGSYSDIFLCFAAASKSTLAARSRGRAGYPCVKVEPSTLAGSLCLDIGLANDAAVFVIFFAKKSAELHAAYPDRI
jgi:hypothetical protein